MRVRLIQVPYHLGHEGVGMGAGPERLVAAGAVEALGRAGHDADLDRVRAEPETNEVAASFRVAARVADRVRDAVAASAFPLVLSGNCMSAVGIVAGLDSRDLGVVWFDAHPDFNTAEATRSGFVDGMGLSILTGTGWNAMRETIAGYRALPERDVVLVGTRDADPAERDRLARSDVAVVSARDVPDGLATPLDTLARRAADVYLHVDLDVVDPVEGRVNEYAARDGLRAEALRSAIEGVGTRFGVRAAALTAYDPACDPDGALARTAVELVAALARAGVSSEEPVAA
ncbi:MAG: arginase family protein [Thermoleophilia bacterium]|nr:arginase family protein [Thermoleophilia bacterium]